MRTATVGLAAVFIATTSVALAKAEAAEAKEIKFAGQLDFGRAPRFGRQQPRIHRVKSRAAFERLGGKGTPVSFEESDLVVVSGSLGCAQGKVEVKTDEQVVTFSVRVVERCTHRTRQLCMKPYVGHFSVSKNAAIAPHVFVQGMARGGRKGSAGDKLKNVSATHLNLSGCGIADEDLTKLKEFKNLTHLYLSDNSITDEGLANLSHMTKLYQLYLGGNTGITDAGLEHLRAPMSSKMQILGIGRTQITHDGLEKLQTWGNQQEDKRGPQINHSLITPEVHE